MKQHIESHSQRGFSLIELMIVIAIVAILATVAYPAYQRHIIKSNRTLAMTDLLSLAQEMERIYSRRFSYSSASLTSNPSAYGELSNYSPTQGTRANRLYDISFQGAITATAFTLRATPLSGSNQEEDGYLEINQSGEKLWDRNNDGDTSDADENHWNN